MRSLMPMRLGMVVVMQHDGHADEERRQERKNERLQERDEQFQQVDRDAPEHDDDADAETKASTDRSGGHDERQQHSQQNVAGDHVRKESNGQREYLRDEADDFP